MDSLFQKIERLYHDALQEPEDDRAAFLDRACAGNRALRLELDELLRCDRDAGRFMESSALEVAARTMARARSRLSPGNRLAHFEIVSLLGAGGMGEVYLAHDTRLERKVALKILPPEMAGDPDRMLRFISEAKAASAVVHPNIATIHEIGEADGIHFISMEYVEGETLGCRIGGASLELPTLLEFGIQIADALDEAHSKGVVHRDLKPANIIVNPKGQAKVLDFGLAKMAKTTVPETGVIMGTVEYMSPEQVLGAEVDHRTDLYSLGVILYAMATGKLPFGGVSTAEKVDQILHGQPEPMASLNGKVSPELERVVRKCLEKNPELRYPSAQELLADLRRLASPEVMSRAAPHVQRKGWRIGGAAVLAVSIVVTAGFLLWRHFHPRATPGQGKVMLAVLPAEDLSGATGQEYFADGLTEEMIAQLGSMQPDRLGVIARTSVMGYRRGRERIDQIGRELGVEYVLETSVRRDARRTRITAQLIQVRDQTHLWAETYQRDLSDIFAVQSDVAARVAKSLALELLPAHRAALAQPPTRNPDAHESYLKGLYYWNRRTADSLWTSIECFQQAIDRDPVYAAAYAGLANSYSVLGNNQFLPSAEAYPRARAAALKALELDEGLAEAHTSLAKVMEDYFWDWPAAEREYRRAIELNPGYASAHQWYAQFLTHLGRHDESAAHIRVARQLDPLSPRINENVGLFLYYARRYDEAIRELKRALTLDPNDGFAHVHLGICYSQRGLAAEAIGELSHAQKLAVSQPLRMAYLGCAYSRAGQRLEASRLLAQLIRLSADEHVPPVAVAWVHAALGEVDQAFACLQRAYDTRDPLLRLVKVEPLLDPLRNDPRWQTLLRRMSLEGR